MKKALFLFLLIFSINSVQAQYELGDTPLYEEDFDTAEGYAQYKQHQEHIREINAIYSKQLGIVEYQGQRYEGCRAIVFTNEDVVYIQISQPEKDYHTPFHLYIKLGLIDGKLPTGNFDNSLFFIRNYEHWSLASHSFHTKQSNLYVQSFSEGYYNMVGSVELDIEEKDIVDFMFWGPLSYESIEVKRITVINPDDYSHNQGKLTIGEETVSMPVGFRDWLPNSQKIYILDRIIPHDQNLEYGVYFEFPRGEFPVGTFKTDNVSQPFKAAFFNKYKTEYPSETELDIKWDKKKKRYEITYLMNFPDGKTIKGSYMGKVPESTF